MEAIRITLKISFYILASISIIINLIGAILGGEKRTHCFSAICGWTFSIIYLTMID